jgi:hypothetical protein
MTRRDGEEDEDGDEDNDDPPRPPHASPFAQRGESPVPGGHLATLGDDGNGNDDKLNGDDK